MTINQIATPELEDWYRLNIGRGCSLDQLHDSLLQAGYAATFALDFLRWRSGGEWQPKPVQAGAAGDPAVTGPAGGGATTDGGETIVARALADHAGKPALEAWWARCDELAAASHIDLGDRAARITGRHVRNGIFFLRGVLSPEECDAMVAASVARIHDSTVVDPTTGQFVPDHRRTSQGTHFARAANPVVAAVEQRLARLSGLPEPNGEGLQILHYRVGGEYRPHFDYFDPATPGCALQLKHGGQRLLTIILYLNDVEAGGGTIFPELGLEFLPEKGAALLFASMTREGALQPLSLHGGSPVTAGVKWIATRWIRVGTYV
ncbi:MAG: 2-oxoglutarate-dependent dioxygenase [Rhodocyclaceae bacterium]|nr:2-oxoglutarate-dependent dioxygenase [Rhodocyclaceae bacterium]